MLKKITFISSLVFVIALCLFKMPSSYSKLDKSADSKNSIGLKSYSNNYCKSENCNFDYTGTEQMFIAPKSGKYKIEAWGASGYSGSSNVVDHGMGGYVTGEIYLLKHNSLFVYVGGNLYDISGNYTYNGGGIGEVNGGGATDIRLINGEWNDFSSLKSRIMVAAGGGGGFLSYDKTSPYYIYSMIERKPGNAGGLVGYDADALYVANNKYMSSTGESGKGGTQTLAGNVEIKESTGYAYKTPGYSIIKASFGKGGLGQYSNGGHTADGGGSGYYGGSHGIHPGSSYPGGGGGSSFISGHNGCVAITEDSTESNIKQRTDSNGKTCTDGTTDITCSYHYSGYKFTDTIMIDGAGYNWTTVKGDYVGQPQPDGTITTGHSGNGYARITYIGE